MLFYISHVPLELNLKFSVNLKSKIFLNSHYHSKMSKDGLKLVIITYSSQSRQFIAQFKCL